MVVDSVGAGGMLGIGKLNLFNIDIGGPAQNLSYIGNNKKFFLNDPSKRDAYRSSYSRDLLNANGVKDTLGSELAATNEEITDSFDKQYQKLPSAYRHPIKSYYFQGVRNALLKGEDHKADKILAKMSRDTSQKWCGEALYHRAVIARRRHDYPTAHKFAAKAYELKPYRPDYATEAGEVSFILGRYDEAIRYFSNANDIYREKDTFLSPKQIKAPLENHTESDEKNDFISNKDNDNDSFGHDYGLHDRRIKGDKARKERAQNYNFITAAYYSKGEYEKALKNAKNALNELANEHPTVRAKIFRNMGTIYGMLGDYQKALEKHYKSFEMQKKLYPPRHINIADILTRLGHDKIRIGKYSEALKDLKKALSIYKDSPDPKNPYIGKVKLYLGSAYSHLYSFEKAEKELEEAYDIFKNSIGDNYRYAHKTLNKLAEHYTKKGDYKTANYYALKALNIGREKFGDNHINTSESYFRLGEVQTDKGLYDDALENLNKSLQIRKDLLSKKSSYIPEKNPYIEEKHPYIAENYDALGKVRQLQGRYDDAAGYFKKARNIYQALSAYKPERKIETSSLYAHAESERGNFKKAKSLLKEAYNEACSKYGAHSLEAVETLSDMVNLYIENVQNYQAEKINQNCFDILKKLNKTHPSLAQANTHYNAGDIFKSKIKTIKAKKNKIGKKHKTDNVNIYTEKAVRHYDKSIHELTAIYGENHRDIANRYRDIGEVLYFKLIHLNDVRHNQNKKNEENDNQDERDNEFTLTLQQAKEALKKSLDITQKLYEDDHPDTADTLEFIGAVEEEQARYNFDHRQDADERGLFEPKDKSFDSSGALSYQEKALEIRKKLLGDYHEQTANSYFHIGQSYFYDIQRKNELSGEGADPRLKENAAIYDKAIENLEKSLKIRKQVLKPDHDEIAESYDFLAETYKERHANRRDEDPMRYTDLHEQKKCLQAELNIIKTDNNIEAFKEDIREIEEEIEVIDEKLESKRHEQDEEAVK